MTWTIIAAPVLALISAACWFYACVTVSRDRELARRRKRAARTGEPLSLAGVDILDGDSRYDLIATLRHQAQWNRWGALFAALAIIVQSLGQL